VTVAAATAVTFSGSATDTKDGDLSSRLVWKSSISGQIGTGATFTRTLTAGSHTITATVIDSIGFTTQAGIIVNVTSGTANTPPTVTITAPVNGASMPAGTTVTFAGSSTDTGDGTLTSRLAWRSSIDGAIGTGGTFTRALTAGTHTITATVTDSGGLTTQKAIIVYAAASSQQQPAAGPTLTLRAYKDKGLQKVDIGWTGFSASSVDIFRNSTRIMTTANDGTVTDAIDQKGAGSYTYRICASGTTTCSNPATVTF
jgi:hypothetical protein